MWLDLLLWSKKRDRRWLWNVVAALFALGAVLWRVAWAKAALWTKESWSFVSWKVHKSSEILDGRAPTTDFPRPKPVIKMPRSTTLPFIGAVFRRKRLSTQANGFAAISSKEPTKASTLPYSLDGPPLTPGSTPSWANQPWHYVFNVSAIEITVSDFTDSVN